MDFSKLTEKSAERINRAAAIAAEHSAGAVDECHLLYSLAEDREGLCPQLVEYAGADFDKLFADVRSLVASVPKVTGDARAYMSAALEKTLNAAETVKGEMKDEFLSVEHLMIALMRSKTEKISKIFNSITLNFLII